MKPKKKFKKPQRFQPKKDNSTSRLNFDNERVSKFDKDVDKWLKRGDSNDYSWYSKNPAIIEAASRIPFSEIAGWSTVDERIGDVNKDTVSGVMSFIFSPNFVPDESIIMQAFNSEYSDIVHANSRNQSYDATDLGILTYAGIEIFSAIGNGIRAYGLMKDYMEPNMYTPSALLEAIGFKPADLRANYSHMYSDLLQLITQSRQIWLPDTMPIVERRFWMNTKIYKDADDDKAQYYLYKQNAYYRYQGYTDKKGGKLIFSLHNDQLTWSAYVSGVQAMIDAIIPDQDRGIIFGDILKAYGKDRIFALNEIALDYRTIPTYNKEVLWQFENLTLSRPWPVSVVQENGTLKQHLSELDPLTADTEWNQTTVAYAIPSNPIINFHQAEQPTGEQITIATRCTSAGTKLLPMYDGNDVLIPNKVVVAPVTAGTETVQAIVAYTYSVNELTGARTLGVSFLRYTHYSDTKAFETIQKLNAYDWAPSLYAFETSGKLSDPPIVRGAICEYDNWTKLSASELKRLHVAVLFSLYNVPVLK